MTQWPDDPIRLTPYRFLAMLPGLRYTVVSMFTTSANSFAYFSYWYWSFAPSR